VIAPFEAKYPNIHVNATWMPTPRDVINQQLAAGSGPDILITDGTADVAKYASAGDVIPLDNYYKQYNWRSRFPAWTFPLLTYKGTFYAVPNNQQALTGIYNVSMFTKYGWTMPKTYDQLVALCKKIQAKGIIPMTLGTADIKNANEWYATVAVNSTLGHDRMIRLFEGKLAWNSPIVRTAFEKLDALYAQGFINNKQSAAITSSQAATEFLSGKAAIEMAGTWAVGDLSTGVTKAPFNWGLFSFPSWTTGLAPTLPVGVGQTFLINAHSKNKDAAVRFVDFAEQPAVLTKGAVFWGLPGLANLNMQTLAALGPHFGEAANVVQGAVRSGAYGFVSWDFWPPSTRVYALNNIESVWLGQISLTTFLNQLESTYRQDRKSGQYVLFSS
jgi:raffinose/stachyose/melibiose transport system substrate-binding protein